jgi:hypothetical protein
MTDRTEGDIAAYAAWRRDPNRVTADDVNRDSPPEGTRLDWVEHTEQHETRALVCPDCGHYDVAHSTGGNCHGGPPGGFGCSCIRMRPIEPEPPTEHLAERIHTLEGMAARASTEATERPDLEVERLLSESTARLVIAFRRWCLRRGLPAPTVDEYQRILDEAAAIGGLSLPEYVLLPEKEL